MSGIWPALGCFVRCAVSLGANPHVGKFYPASEREFRRTLELSPRYATAHQWYAEYLAVVGRIDESLAEIRLAQELEPLSLIINTQAGWILTLDRRYDEAIEQLRKTVDLDPSFQMAHADLGLAYGERGRSAEAVAEFQKAVKLRDSADNRLWLAWAYAGPAKGNERGRSCRM